MKKMICFLIVMASTHAFALNGIENSSLSLRHQSKIEQAILKTCANLYRYSLVELNNSVQLDHVDNGITDEYHTTTLKLTSRLDQITDEYQVVVKSSVASAYDHDDQDWGLISVDSIQGCQQ